MSPRLVYRRLTSSLKYEDIIPDTELKAKIDAWVLEGQAGRPDEVMDIDR